MDLWAILEDLLQLIGGATVVSAALGWAAREAIKAQFEKQQKRLEATLRANESRLVRLEEKRAEVIAELYKKLIVAVSDAHSFLSLFEYEGEPSKDEKRETFAKSFQALSDFYFPHKIYFSRASCEKIDALFGNVRGPTQSYSLYLNLSKDDELGNFKLMEKWVESHEEFKTLVPEALSAVQDEFRAILGVPESDAA